jgi:FtsX-like permease family
VQDSATALFVGLGAVALLVGGVGVANVMVIAALERRSEIGLRRAGRDCLHVGAQFLIESLLLPALGGSAGVVAGAAVTAAYAAQQAWAVVVPAIAVWGGLGGRRSRSGRWRGRTRRCGLRAWRRRRRCEPFEKTPEAPPPPQAGRVGVGVRVTGQPARPEDARIRQATWERWAFRH